MIRSLYRLSGAQIISYAAVGQSLQQVNQAAHSDKSYAPRIERREHLSILQKLTLWVCLVLLIGGCAVMVTNRIQNTENRYSGVSASVQYVVQPGDTLWKIAMKVNNNSNVYNRIDKIEHLNQLSDNSNIYPGQVLLIPPSKP